MASIENVLSFYDRMIDELSDLKTEREAKLEFANDDQKILLIKYLVLLNNRIRVFKELRALIAYESDKIKNELERMQD